jgi:hypothetical protein
MMLQQRIAVVSAYQENLALFDRLFRDESYQPVFSTTGYNAQSWSKDIQWCTWQLPPIAASVRAIGYGLRHLKGACRYMRG